MNRDAYILGRQIAKAINNKKVISMDVLDVAELTPLAELFIVAVASNVRQTKAIADEVEDLLSENRRFPIHKEGYNSANWILLDYGEVIVHILDEEYAQFYGLTRLWQDAKNVDLLQEEAEI